MSSDSNYQDAEAKLAHAAEVFLELYRYSGTDLRSLDDAAFSKIVEALTVYMNELETSLASQYYVGSNYEADHQVAIADVINEEKRRDTRSSKLVALAKKLLGIRC